MMIDCTVKKRVKRETWFMEGNSSCMLTPQLGQIHMQLSLYGLLQHFEIILVVLCFVLSKTCFLFF